jgi:hypothetical protein
MEVLKMTITARYPGTCSICGRRIIPGQKIEWNKETRQSAHAECKAKESTEPAPYRISGGSGYGCAGWQPGQVVQASKALQAKGYPEWLYVVRARQRYVREDGLSFGVGDDSGYIYSAECRAATEAEAAPYIERLAKATAVKAAQAEVDEIKKQIRQNGERPEGNNVVNGERLLNTQTIYGGGDWFVIDNTHIWFIQNNGGDGDDWSVNNVRTGGAGAIGWRVERNEELVNRLRELAAVIEGK